MYNKQKFHTYFLNPCTDPFVTKTDPDKEWDAVSGSGKI